MAATKLKTLLRSNKVKGKFTRPEGAGNFDNMDDFNITKAITTTEGTIQNAPTNAKDIANKEYVDTIITNYLASHPHQDVNTTASPSFTNNIKITPVTNLSKVLVNTADGSDTGVLRLAGGGDALTTRGAIISAYGNENVAQPGNIILQAGEAGSIAMLDELSMNTNKITGVVDPTADQDAATKKYVDTATTNHPHQDVNTTASPSFVAAEIGDITTAYEDLTVGNDGTQANIGISNHASGTQYRYCIESSDANVTLDIGYKNAASQAWYTNNPALTIGYVGGVTCNNDLTVTGEVAGANLYPQRADMWHDGSTVVNGNAIQVFSAGLMSYNFFATQNAAANGDIFTNSFFLKAGTYTLSVIGQTGANRGLIDWSIDGVDVETGQDWYSGGTVNSVVKTASVTVTGDGYHQLTGTVNGKNGSSSDYFIALAKFWLKPTTDPARA